MSAAVQAYKGPCVECGNPTRQSGAHRCAQCENEIEFPSVARDMLRERMLTPLEDAAMFPSFTEDLPDTTGESTPTQRELWDAERWGEP